MRSLPAKKVSTKEERCIELVSSMQVLAEIASMSISATSRVGAQINIMIENERSMRDNGNDVKQGGGIGGKETKLVPVKKYIANPLVKKKQTQARKQPHAIGAPTTSSYKAAGNRSQRERKETEKAKTAKALGYI